MSTPDPVTVLFLAGIGRSGTTLIERTLHEVAGVTALGEVLHLWERGLGRDELCACGAPFSGCPFWQRVGQEAFGGWDRVDLDRVAALKSRVDRATRVPGLAVGRPSALTRDAAEYADHFARVYRAAAAVTGGGVLVDSSKQVSLAWCLRHAPGVDLRVVHCVRDSRGVAFSWGRDVARPEAVDPRFGRMPTYSATTVSALWMLHNLEIEALGTRVPTARLRYEDFVADPVGALRPVLALAGLGTAELPHVAPASVRLGASHSCAGNPMRFQVGEIPLRTDTRWRTGQEPGQRRLVSALTAPLLARYRYPLAGSTSR